MSEEMKTRLLVVDDEQSIRRLCMTIGNTLGYVCAEAESAEAALGRLESDAPDLLLTDLKLPNMSGVDLLKQTKQRSEERRVGKECRSGGGWEQESRTEDREVSYGEE